MASRSRDFFRENSSFSFDLLNENEGRNLTPTTQQPLALPTKSFILQTDEISINANLT